MTIEHQIVVGVEDIKAVIVACKCGMRLAMSPDKICIPANCPDPDCAIAWSDKPSREVSSGHEVWASANLNFADAIKQIRKHGGNASFRILLEFDLDCA